MNAKKNEESAIAVVTRDIYDQRDEFVKVLADPNINFEREAEFAVQLMEGSDYLLKVAQGNRQSVVNAVKNIAAIGISLNPAKKQAYLVPRRPKACQAVAVCLDISYMGLLDLAVDSGSIRWGQAKLVRENDDYESQGVDLAPIHKYKPFGGKDRGAIIGVYVVVKTPEGDYLTHEMDLDAIFAIRDRSESYKAFKKGDAKSSPWDSDFGEMAKKTVIKQAAKTWPRRSDRLERAIHHMNTDGGEGLVDINDPPAAAAPPVQAKVKLTQRGLEKAIKAVQAGDYTLEEIEVTHDLSAEQRAQLVDASRVVGAA